MYLYLTSGKPIILKSIVKISLILTFLLTFSNVWSQTFYTLPGTRAWDDKLAWEVEINGSKSPATNSPTSNDFVIITRSINIPENASANCKRLTIFRTSGNIELLVEDNAILTVAGDIYIESPSKAALRNSINVERGNLNVGGSVYLGNNTFKGKTLLSMRGNGVSNGFLKVKGSIVKGNTQNTATGTLNIADHGILEIEGNLALSNNLVGTFEDRTTIVFKGTNFQILPAGTIFGHLQIANPTGVILSEPLDTDNLLGNLVVASGILDDNGYSITGKSSKFLEVRNGAKLVVRHSNNINDLAFPTGFGTVTLAANSTVVFNGSSVQKIAALNYGNLEFLGGAGKQKFLAGNTTARNVLVSADLMLDLGSLNIGSNTLTLTTSGAIKNYNALRYIVLNNAGKMLVEDIGQTPGARNTEVIFPVGTSVNFTPAYIINRGTTNDFAVNVVDGVKNYATNTPITQKVVNKTWDVECVNRVGTPSVELRLQWNPADETFGFDNTSCYITHYTNNAWTLGTVFQNAAQNSMSMSMPDVSTFSPFTVSNSVTPLPVELVFFKAAKKDNEVLLTWQTASEKNCLGYDILASTDGKHFESVGYLPSKNGNATYTQNYEFLDKTHRSGLVYYRLKQTDLDGAVAYYATKVVDMGRFTETLTAYPNPFQNQFELKLQTSVSQEVILQINDMTGKTVYQNASKVVAGGNIIPIELNRNLPAGLYILTAKTADQLYTTRLIKQ